MKILFINIANLLGVLENNMQPLKGDAMNNLLNIENAWLLSNDGFIEDYGSGDFANIIFDEIIDLDHNIVFPTYCDSHSHFVFGNYRIEEYMMKLNGKSYAEIANAGGGILNSAKAIVLKSEDELFEIAKIRIKKAIEKGTGALEIKSGYGLILEQEIKILKVIAKLKLYFDIPIKATYLMAHALPTEFKYDRKAYIDNIINIGLPYIHENNLADFVDVFCENNFFSVVETEQLIFAANKFNLKAKLHINQLNSFGALQMSLKNKVLSIDHLEQMTEKDIFDLTTHSKTNNYPIAVSLPMAAFYLQLPQTPARKLIDANIPFAIASDYNPGSAPVYDMAKVLSMACISQRITINEAFNAATINGAFAMELQNEVGSISKGKKANFIVTKNIPNFNYINYSFGDDYISSVYINAKKYL